jgi:hypothetical protein
MMAKDQWWPFWIWAVGVAFILGAGMVSWDKVNWKKLAVDHGAAHYEVDKYGVSSFHWNDEKQEGKE